MPGEAKSLCVDDLRHAEYYGMQPVFDELYRKSKSGEIFTNLMEIILRRENILLRSRGESEVYCHRESARLPAQTGQTQRHPETERQNKAARHPLHLGQADTAMY